MPLVSYSSVKFLHAVHHSRRPNNLAMAKEINTGALEAATPQGANHLDERQEDTRRNVVLHKARFWLSLCESMSSKEMLA